MVHGLSFKTILNIVLILATITFGVLLHRTGKPYNQALFAMHKLITVVFVVLVIKMTISSTRMYGINLIPLLLVLLAALSMLGLIASGGAMSLNREHDLMLLIHKVLTLVFLVSVSGIFIAIFQDRT